MKVKEHKVQIAELPSYILGTQYSVLYKRCLAKYLLPTAGK